MSTLKPNLNAIHQLIISRKDQAAENLQNAGRSRLARLVRSLPCTSSKKIEDLAIRDLPLASMALGLAAASSSLNCVEEKELLDASKAADIALIMLGIPDGIPLRELIQSLHNYISSQLEAACSLDYRIGKENFQTNVLPIERMNVKCKEFDYVSFSVEQFTPFFQRDEPVVIKNCASDWPAFRKWVSTAYLERKFGHRVVPVEYHSSSQEMEEKFCSIATVLNHMKTSDTNNPTSSVYLAQHPLLDYIPALEEDIKQPKYIAAVGKSKADVINLWMGSASTGSKLHFDTADNILVQVAGHKKLVLISPQHSDMLYPASPIDNFSPVNVEKPDLMQYPLFSEVKGMLVHLEPGDAVFIPAKHWHWVKAITSSISVNFWF